MKLGIVGHGHDKFKPFTMALARNVIEDLIKTHKPTHIVSGASHLGGIDLWAEEIAHKLEVETEIYPPKVNIWGAPGGYKDRNLQIASASDLVVCIVVKELPEGYSGMRFPGCYHCKGRNRLHVKSGGCWTAWKAENREWKIIG